MRLTRRGRAVVLVFLLLLAGLGLAFAAPASRAADPVRERPTAEVHPGDTLWSIAARYVSSRDPVAAVEEIRRLNRLTDYTVHPGQQLVLPSRREVRRRSADSYRRGEACDTTRFRWFGLRSGGRRINVDPNM